MQLFSEKATILKKFTHEKLKKTSSKVAQKYSIKDPELPKRPKQKNSCSKIWLIDQLYIKLGLLHQRPLRDCQCKDINATLRLMALQ